MDQLIIDIASAPIAGVEAFIEPATAPKNYTDPAKIAAAIAEKTAERVSAAGLDLDLARITAIGCKGHDWQHIDLCKTDDDERLALGGLAQELTDDDRIQIITYNGHAFDLPLLMRRARYLGVEFPKLNLDRYRSPHCDLLLELTDRDVRRNRSLGFYAKRLGWTDLAKPLSGEQESRVHDTGEWELLDRSVQHDLEATYRLAQWLGVVTS